MRTAAIVAVACLLSVSLAFAQESGGGMANPITDGVKNAHEMAKGNLVKAAEQVPENLYSFKATPDVRSFGQLIGHVANANYMICGAVSGEKRSGADIEKTMSAKADLVKALSESFAFCDKVYEGMTDAEGAKTVAFFGGQQAKLSVLAFNNMHNYEHYGNVVTYMRLNKMVPPSSQGR
ncbi:MAG: DinB family protein [Acidobacteriota bacterium]